MNKIESGFKIWFTASRDGVILRSEREGRETLSIENLAGELTVSLYYDVNEKPLTLRSRVSVYEEIEIIIFPHRIELWVNNTLADEEWPFGNPLFGREDRLEALVDYEIKPYERRPHPQPSVTGSFAGGAEGWHPEPSVFCGDCMPHVADGRFHLLYLRDRHHHESKWGLGAHSWSHISTVDFDRWDIHPTAVDIDLPEEASICTGSHIQKDGMHYLYYTVRPTADGIPAKILRSVSTDGYHYEKDEKFGFTLSDKYRGGGARDPKIFLAEDGLYHMIITAALVSPRRGVLAHLTSADLDVWRELEDNIYVSPDEREPECPDYFKLGEYYYLTYCISGEAHYMYSKKPFSDWISPEDDTVPCGKVPKCAEWEGRMIFVGFKPLGGYAGFLTYRAARQKADGRLSFETI